MATCTRPQGGVSREPARRSRLRMLERGTGTLRNVSAVQNAAIMPSVMDILSVLFRWRRDQREARQEARDEKRLYRESRRDLFELLGQSVAICERRASLAPGDPELSRELGERLRLQQLVVDREIGIHPKSPLLTGPPALPTPGGKSQPDVKGRLVTVVEGLLKSGQCSSGLELLDLADEASRTFDPQIVYLRTRCLEDLGRVEEALTEVERLIASSGDKGRAQSMKCFLLLRANRAREARTLAETMFAEDEDQRAFATLSAVALSQQHYDEAFRLTKEAVKRWPGDPILLEANLLASRAANLGHPASIARQILDVSPNDPLALETLGSDLLSDGRAQEALTHALKLVEVEPHNCDAHILLARVFQEIGDRDGVLRQAEIAGKLAPNDFRIPVIRLMMVSLGSATDEESFRQILTESTAVILNPKTPGRLRASVLLLRGMSLAAYGATELADLDFREAMSGELPKSVWKAAVTPLPSIPVSLRWPDDKTDPEAE